MLNLKTAIRPTCIALLFCAAMLAGCSNDGGKPKVHRREGWAESIDTKTKSVKMKMRLKNGEEKSISGTYTDETVVVINGRNMEIKDIKPGDPIEVFGIRSDGGDTLTATKVIVTRKEKEWQSTGKDKKADEVDSKSSDTSKDEASGAP